MKKHHYSVLSHKKCKHPGCRKRLKQNLIDKNPKAELCFKHHQICKISAKKTEEVEHDNR